MAYEKLGLADGQVLKAEHLEHIENGIVANEEAMENLKVTSSHDGEGNVTITFS